MFVRHFNVAGNHSVNQYNRDFDLVDRVDLRGIGDFFRTFTKYETRNPSKERDIFGSIKDICLLFSSLNMSKQTYLLQHFFKKKIAGKILKTRPANVSEEVLSIELINYPCDESH